MSAGSETGPRVRYEVRRNEDGVVREVCPGLEWDDDFIWAEGNFSCDCNRELFFCEAVGEDDPNRGCGTDAYSVRVTAIDDGCVLYEDGDWDHR